MIINFLKNWATKRGNKYFIYDRADSSVKELYMIRYILVKNRFFGIYLHEFIKSDDEVHHSHPWAFNSVILKGSYKEEILEIEKNDHPIYKLKKKIRIVKAGQFLYRKANHIHRVILTDNKPVTLSIVWTKTQEWGFFLPMSKDTYRFIHWSDFLKNGLNKVNAVM